MSNRLILYRKCLDNGSFGKLYFRGEFQMYTLEPPWKGNQKNISCVPPGIYILKQYSSKKYPGKRKSKKIPYVFSLHNYNLGVGTLKEDYRTNILIHILNVLNETLGCIGVGLFQHRGKWGISSSRFALEKLIKLVQDNDIEEIEIIQS